MLALPQSHSESIGEFGFGFPKLDLPIHFPCLPRPRETKLWVENSRGVPLSDFCDFRWRGRNVKKTRMGQRARDKTAQGRHVTLSTSGSMAEMQCNRSYTGYGPELSRTVESYLEPSGVIPQRRALPPSNSLPRFPYP